VDEGIVMLMEPVVVAQKFRSFSSHIFSQVSQNIAVKVRVDHSVRKNKFTANNPLHFVELQTCRTFFAVGDC
jgi:hypothetical protein